MTVIDQAPLSYLATSRVRLTPIAPTLPEPGDRPELPTRSATSVPHASTVPHATLVAQAQQGSREAMETLIATIRPMVTRYCRSKLAGYSGGREVIDDVAQEICMTIFASLERYQDRGAPFTAWVYGIAANKVADAQRRVMRAPTLVEEVPDCVDSAPTPEDRAISTINSELLTKMMQQLPEKTRSVVIMRTHGVSAEETGREVGMSAGAVRVTYHRALAKLRKLMQSERDAETAEALRPAI